MDSLPDPRRYHLHAEPVGKGGQSEFRASQQELAVPRPEVVATLLRQDRESELRQIVAQATSPAECNRWLDALEAALTPPAGRGTARVCLFAIPVLLVSGGANGTLIPAVVPDIAPIWDLLQQAGVLGPTRSFGLSNALTGAESLEEMPWTKLYRLAAGDGPLDPAEFGLPPEPVLLRSNGEQVDLRFLPGAAVTAAGAPVLQETDAAIGQWGMAFTRSLAKQLSVSGASVLPIPRSPMSFPRAVRSGRFALAELGFQLFVSNAVRRARTKFGDPDATVAACSDGSVRVRLTSRLDSSFDEEYRWALQPADDLQAVSASIFGLLAEVRLERITVLDAVQQVDTVR